MRVLVDTNVVLDVLLNREPWVMEAAAVWRLCSEGSITGYVSASSFTDIYYYIVTRNIRDFETSAVPAVTADELLQRHSSHRP